MLVKFKVDYCQKQLSIEKRVTEKTRSILVMKYTFPIVHHTDNTSYIVHLHYTSLCLQTDDVLI